MTSSHPMLLACKYRATICSQITKPSGSTRAQMILLGDRAPQIDDEALEVRERLGCEHITEGAKARDPQVF